MKYQLGATLISLLIGLLIAMLCIIAVLGSYRTIVKTGVESRVAATHDAQLQTGLTTAQLFLQNAGFGLEGLNNLLSEADIQVESQSVSALLWRYKSDDNIICQGLADIQSSDGRKRKFVLLESNPTICDEVTNLNEFTWEIQSTLANLEDYSTDQSNPTQITFEKTSSSCAPFGAGGSDDTATYPLINITAQTSTQQIAGLATVQAPVCLLNITS